jgi:outer membrane protein assembly factor BamB
MSKFRFISIAAAIGAITLLAADWPMQNGGPERNGWARSEHLLTKTSVKNLAKLYAYQAGTNSGASSALGSPIVNGNLITYIGFKEMLIFGDGGNRVFSVDADLNKLIWKADLPFQGDQSKPKSSQQGCAGGLTSQVAMAGSSSAPMHFAATAARLPATGGRPFRRPSPYFPPLWQSVYPLHPDTLTQLNALYTVSSDGFLHILNSSTGEDLIAAFQFVPPHAKVTSLNVWENMIYATTADNCDGYRNALYAVNLLTNEKQVVVFAPENGGFAGSAGTAIGRDGTVYVQVTQAPGDKPGVSRDAVLALTPRDLKMKDYFAPGRILKHADLSRPGITPIVFSWMGKEMVVAGGQDGGLYLLDSKSLGGADHHTPVFELPSKTRKREDAGFRGSFSSWQDVDTQQRWIYAPNDRGIAAFKLTSENGKPTLAPLWTSDEIAAPAPVVIANGMTFTLSTGAQPTLYALDALTGKEIYSSGSAISGHPQGALAVANGRIYFSTHENTVYCFGLSNENTQLAEQ